MSSLKHCNSTSSASSHLGSSLNLCVVNQSNLGNRILDWEKRSSLMTRRNVTINCGLKSRPVSTQRGTPLGWLSANSVYGDEIKVFQSHIVLPAPDGQISPKRGLSGSKIRKSSATSRSSRQTPRNSFVSDLGQELSVQPQQRPLPHTFRTRVSNTTLMEGGSDLLSNYKWNSSNQGLRLQHELTKLSSIRSMKRNSGMVSYRIDHMYCLHGSRLNLLSRYGVNSEEMAKTHDSLVAGEETASLDMAQI